MEIATVLPKWYGLAIIDMVLYCMTMMWMGFQVVWARKKFEVKLPAAYENKEDSVFNRYQRAHYNAIESAPIFLSTLLIGALTSPISCSIAGIVYIFFRIRYCLGYYKAVSSRFDGRFMCKLF